jgi:hypothetical protein
MAAVCSQLQGARSANVGEMVGRGTIYMGAEAATLGRPGPRERT